MIESWEGFGERIKKLNPLFSLGKGMDVGSLNPYVQPILVQVILTIFYRELNDDANRTKQDISLIVKETVEQMKLTATDKQVERMTAGLLYYGPESLNQPFQTTYFNEQTSTWDTQTFKYLNTDELYTDLESSGSIIYKLTDVSQEMIFMSREMSEEFSITIEQLYSIQLIKNGNFKKAIRNLDTLIARVNRLLLEERSFQKEVQNNPKLLILDEQLQREDKKEKIEKQFEEEKSNFRIIMSLLDKAKSNENYAEIQQEVLLLQDKIDYTRQMHDRFANLVIQNIAMEMNLKTENPMLFWDKPLLSFKEDIYENWLMKKGLEQLDTVEHILAPLFSPKNPFILPIDWLWGEQEVYETTEELIEEEEAEQEEELIERKITDWNSISTAWEYVFEHLLQFGEFSLAELKELPYEVQDQWFKEKETFELWMMFNQKPLEINVLNGNQTFNDERETLLYHLMQKSERFKKLEGQLIYTEFDYNETPLQWEKYHVTITPFKLRLKENVK